MSTTPSPTTTPAVATLPGATSSVPLAGFQTDSTDGSGAVLWLILGVVLGVGVAGGIVYLRNRR